MEPLDFDPTPDRLVDERGHVRFGVFNAPLPDVDVAESRFGWLGLPAPRIVRDLRLKQWQHFVLVTPELLVTLAVVDAGYLRTGWVQVVERERRFEHARKGPRLDARVARALWDDTTHLRARGFEIAIANHLSAGEHRLRLAVDAGDAGPAVAGELVAHHDLARVAPLVVSLPVGTGRAMYSHKVPLPVSGELRVGERRYAIDPTESSLILDIHKAHYPRRTWWKWATFAGRDARGRHVGLNLTENMASAVTPRSENALWVDGRCVRLSHPTFTFDRGRIRDPWRLTTHHGEVDLSFRPAGGRAERLDLGLVRSHFDQLYGTFHGAVTLGDGTRVEVEGLRGVCEDHDARW